MVNTVCMCIACMSSAAFLSFKSFLKWYVLTDIKMEYCLKRWHKDVNIIKNVNNFAKCQHFVNSEKLLLGFLYLTLFSY